MLLRHSQQDSHDGFGLPASSVALEDHEALSFKKIIAIGWHFFLHDNNILAYLLVLVYSKDWS